MNKLEMKSLNQLVVEKLNEALKAASDVMHSVELGGFSCTLIVVPNGAVQLLPLDEKALRAIAVLTTCDSVAIATTVLKGALRRISTEVQTSKNDLH